MQPLEWPVEEGPPEEQTDPVGEAEAHSQNLQTNRREHRHGACPRPTRT